MCMLLYKRSYVIGELNCTVSHKWTGFMMTATEGLMLNVCKPQLQLLAVANTCTGVPPTNYHSLVD